MRKRVRVLLAGFGPFPGAPSNPSSVLVGALARRRRPALAGVELITHIFATSYAAVDRDLAGLLARGPGAVLVFGLAARRRHLCIETRARNAVSILFPDATGYRPPHPVIAAGAPSARRGHAPFVRLLSAARGKGFPARLSRDAGRYLCNYVYWLVLQHYRRRGPLVVFVHVPKVGAAPVRRHGQSRRRNPARKPLLHAAEALLLALIAATRR